MLLHVAVVIFIDQLFLELFYLLIQLLQKILSPLESETQVKNQNGTTATTDDNSIAEQS